MHVEAFKQLLEESPLAFEEFKGKAHVDEGWKLSIQGTTMEDIIYLYEHLFTFLAVTGASFKFGTKRLLDSANEEQRTKVLTVYIPNKVDPRSYAELCYLNIKDYEGGEVDPKVGYEHYKNAIYYRNDRDADGNYIHPTK